MAIIVSLTNMNVLRFENLHIVTQRSPCEQKYWTMQQDNMSVRLMPGNAERSGFLFLLLSMSRSFQNNFVLETGPVSAGAWRLLCSWDFSVVNEKAIQYNKNNLGIQLKVHTCLTFF